MFKMNQDTYMLFIKELDHWNEKYDPEVKMIREPLHSPGYHTTLKEGYTHPTRESLTYAVALLDSGIDEYRLRAEDILERILSLQDTDPFSKTYGIWSWFYEESLDEMSPPDWNWADFCGKELLQVVLDHPKRISPNLLHKVKEGISHASKSIIRRNVDPNYTNIAIMDTYVTLVAGQALNIDEFRRYGQEKLRRMHNYTSFHGFFTEYNSPTYTMTALMDLSLMLQHVKDDGCLGLINALYHIGWECLAHHFHPTTRQWAGPYSRCYDSIQDRKFWSKIQLAAGGKIYFLPHEELDMEINWPRINLQCPPEFLRYFTDEQLDRSTCKVIFKGDRLQPSQIAVNHMTPEYVISSFNRSDMWNQRRGMIGYFGSYREPISMHLRFLHDGYDYSSAMLHCVQSKGNLLAMMNFATDGGDTHIHLDKVKDSTILAADLRLRLEFSGSIGQLECPDKWKSDHSISCRLKDTVISFHLLRCIFDNYPVTYEVNREMDKIAIDVIFYQGQTHAFSFDDLSEAFCAMALRVHTAGGEKTQSNPIITPVNDKLRAEWNVDGDTLMVEAHHSPQNLQTLYQSRGLMNDLSF